MNDEIPACPVARSAFVMRFRLGGLLRFRFACAWLGGVVLPLLACVSHSGAALPAAVLLLCVIGEFAERTLFFRAAVSAKMPGGAAT
jgi:hypothetical protein